MKLLQLFLNVGKPGYSLLDRGKLNLFTAVNETEAIAFPFVGEYIFSEPISDL